MDLSFVVKHRLEQLNLEQRDLARATQVTESYISQLLTRKKAPPAPRRTAIYDRMGVFLRLPVAELARLADLQRQEETKRRLAEPPAPLFAQARDLVLRKCRPEKQKSVRAIFENHPFGELERLVTQKLLDVVKGIAKREIENVSWLQLMVGLVGCSYEEMRVAIFELLDTDVFHISVENCVSLLEPVIESWDIDVETFAMEVALNPRLAPGPSKRFEFVEKEPEYGGDLEPGFEEFLRDATLRANASDDEIEFLRRLRFKDKRPAALYYYRELQNLRDPLHFQTNRTDGGKDDHASR
jgi:transcriptional regulator with XRE-family HTH domain